MKKTPHFLPLLLFFLFTYKAYSFPTFENKKLQNEHDWCQTCHSNQTPSHSVEYAPLLPQQFSMDWKMYEFVSQQRPPVQKIENPDQVIHGSTYYDWERKSMTEVYREHCIDIFPLERNYPCQFTSIENKTYLIRFDKIDAEKPQSCCLWQKNNFWAPRPDVILNMKFDQNINFQTKETHWWILDIPFPGPFGYGFYRNHTPAAFWFPVISGWVQQEFENFREGKPAEKHFQLPKICKLDIPVCGE